MKSALELFSAFRRGRNTGAAVASVTLHLAIGFTLALGIAGCSEPTEEGLSVFRAPWIFDPARPEALGKAFFETSLKAGSTDSVCLDEELALVYFADSSSSHLSHEVEFRGANETQISTAQLNSPSDLDPRSQANVLAERMERARSQNLNWADLSPFAGLLPFPSPLPHQKQIPYGTEKILWKHGAQVTTLQLISCDPNLTTKDKWDQMVLSRAESPDPNLWRTGDWTSELLIKKMSDGSTALSFLEKTVIERSESKAFVELRLTLPTQFLPLYFEAKAWIDLEKMRVVPPDTGSADQDLAILELMQMAFLQPSPLSGTQATYWSSEGPRPVELTVKDPDSGEVISSYSLQGKPFSLHLRQGKTLLRAERMADLERVLPFQSSLALSIQPEEECEPGASDQRRSHADALLGVQMSANELETFLRKKPYIRNQSISPTGYLKEIRKRLDWKDLNHFSSKCAVDLPTVPSQVHSLGYKQVLLGYRRGN